MNTSQKGITSGFGMAVVALISLTLAVYIVTQAREIAALDYQIQHVSPRHTTNNSDWKTYTNTKYGFEFKYPADWIFQDSTDELSGFYVAVIDPKYPGKPDTDVPASKVIVTLQEVNGDDQVCVSNDWEEGFGGPGVLYKTICFSGKSKLISMMNAVGTSSKETEDKILSTFTLTSPVN